MVGRPYRIISAVGPRRARATTPLTVIVIPKLHSGMPVPIPLDYHGNIDPLRTPQSETPSVRDARASTQRRTRALFIVRTAGRSRGDLAV